MIFSQLKAILSQDNYFIDLNVSKRTDRVKLAHIGMLFHALFINMNAVLFHIR